MDLSVLVNLILAVGSTTIVVLLYKLASFAHFYFIQGPALHHYILTDAKAEAPPYAIVTGGSAGIGFALAKELATSYGVNLILISHNLDKLEDAMKQIRAAAPERDVKVIVLDATRATYEDIKRALEEQGIFDFQVSILINNVGGLSDIFTEPFKPFRSYVAPAEIESVISINIRFMTYLTHLLIPTLARFAGGESGKRRSLIINMSSAAEIGVPFQTVYGACKAYVTNFSIALGQELTAIGLPNIDVVSIVPGEVRSSSYKPDLRWNIPTAEKFAREVLRLVGPGRGRRIVPFWAHHVLLFAMQMLPTSILEKFLSENLQNLRKWVDGRDVLERKIK